MGSHPGRDSLEKFSTSILSVSGRRATPFSVASHSEKSGSRGQRRLMPGTCSFFTTSMAALTYEKFKKSASTLCHRDALELKFVYLPQHRHLAESMGFKVMPAVFSTLSTMPLRTMSLRG